MSAAVGDDGTQTDEEDFVVLGDITTQNQKRWKIDDLVDASHSLAEEFGITSKVTIDKERVSNVLRWLHVHDIVTIERDMVTPRPILDIHRRREHYIHLAMTDNNHLWRSLAMVSDKDMEWRRQK